MNFFKISLFHVINYIFPAVLTPEKIIFIRGAFPQAEATETSLLSQDSQFPQPGDRNNANRPPNLFECYG
jgi:hypothetical protein